MKYPDDCNPPFRPYSGASLSGFVHRTLDIVGNLAIAGSEALRGSFSACLLIYNRYGQHPNFRFHIRRYKPLILLVTQGLLYLLVYGT